MAKENNSTPVRKQYLSIKKQHPDAILFFRLGDFYETFDEDAHIASRELDIVLTSRKVSKNQRVPMAGIPFHAADNYISKLIEKGYHVAICEQIGDQPQKGLFPREVVRVVTPGTLIEPGLIKSEKNNYLACICVLEKTVGLAYIDITTGDAGVTEFADDSKFNRLQAEISRINPAEVLIPENLEFNFLDNMHLTKAEPWKFEITRSTQNIQSTFDLAVIDGLGLKNKNAAICAYGGLLDYLQETDPSVISHGNFPTIYSIDSYMILDPSTRRNLELTETLRGGNEGKSLLSIIDKTVSAMGKRKIHNWINQPLKDLQDINERLNAVSHFFEHGLLRIEFQNYLKKLSDIERISNRINTNHATPRDLVSLRESLKNIPEILKLLSEDLEMIGYDFGQIDACEDELALLSRAIDDDPPATLQHTGVIRAGYSPELDAVLEASDHARIWIANLEKIEKEKHGIKTLKVGYNKVFGYYIEISKSQLNKAPDNYIRKQTLVNAERFITPELKEYEAIVLNADEEIRNIEKEVFASVCKKLSLSIEKFMRLSRFIAELDVFLSFAQVASEQNYVRPELSEGISIEIKNGRHPVVETTLSSGGFIANDTALTESDRIHILTGPNMSGKSTYLRQVALIVLLAQIGSYVPAESAAIGLVDRIFTRIGAQDEIHAGQSTFMVEMVETANILNNATVNSLLILDEIGRGTSTYDGLSIAWAVIEHLHNHPKLKPRTLFATHFHELTALPQKLPLVSNHNVAVSESGREVVFLHKIVPGGSDRSYGIHVAQLAGIPNLIISRANDLLAEFEQTNGSQHREIHDVSEQLTLFTPETPLLDALEDLDIDSISPIEALNTLYHWKNTFKKD